MKDDFCFLPAELSWHWVRLLYLQPLSPFSFSGLAPPLQLASFSVFLLQSVKKDIFQDRTQLPLKTTVTLFWFKNLPTSEKFSANRLEHGSYYFMFSRSDQINTQTRHWVYSRDTHCDEHHLNGWCQPTCSLLCSASLRTSSLKGALLGTPGSFFTRLLTPFFFASFLSFLLCSRT